MGLLTPVPLAAKIMPPLGQDCPWPGAFHFPSHSSLCFPLGVGPAHAVALEDSENGLQAALAAGIAVVATPSLYLTDEDFTGAKAVVSNLGEPDRPHEHLAGIRFSRPWVTVDGLQAVLDCAGGRDS